jgi:hypothetical protein
MGRTISFTVRQAVLIWLAVLAYFGVRGLTESDPAGAQDNADRVLTLERWIGLDLERELQDLVHRSDLLVDLVNWIYIWGHWPVVIATLVYLAVADRPTYALLRNAMFISGAIGLVIFATFAVAPPRLFGVDYVDTVTIRSNAYRVLQPPQLVNKYAAVPSLHFGWNLLVAVAWAHTSKRRIVRLAAVVMPMAMGFAVVATANHWVFDVLAGGVVALGGLAIELRRSRVQADDGGSATDRGGLTPDLGEPLGRRHQGQGQHEPQDRDEQPGNGQSDRQGDDALGPLHDPALGVQPERLGLGTLVGDQPRGGHDRHRQHGQQAPLVGDQVPHDAADEHRVGDPVGRGIEEGAPHRRRPGRLGHRAVQQVGDRRDQQQHEAQAEVAAADEQRRHQRCGNSGDREGIGRETGSLEADPEGIDGPLDRRTPLTVKHRLAAR